MSGKSKGYLMAGIKVLYFQLLVENANDAIINDFLAIFLSIQRAVVRFETI